MTQPVGVLASLLPELHYLVDPALKYGIHQTDDQQADFLERMSVTEMNELGRVAERYSREKHAELVSDFFDDFPIDGFSESAKLHALLSIIDHAGFSLSPADWNSLKTHITALNRFGSFRLASERAIAARLIADYGDKGRAAVPALQLALTDHDLRVQVWAHVALARISGDAYAHELAVRAIYAKHDRTDALGCHVDDVGREACAAIEKFRQLTSELGGP